MSEISDELRAKLADVLGIEEEGGLGPDIVTDVGLALAKARARGVQSGREMAAADIEAWQPAHLSPGSRWLKGQLARIARGEATNG